MNCLSTDKRCQIVAALVEGNSIRATCRMTGAAKNTVTKLLVDLGSACEGFSDRVMRDLACERLQCDEIWSFVGCKEHNLPPEKRGRYDLGDVYTWVALDAETKLVPAWLVGLRDASYAIMFMRDLASRLRHRVQLTTDGLQTYVLAVDTAFEGEIDYAMLRKIFGYPKPLILAEGVHYSPSRFVRTWKLPMRGAPDPEHVSTSLVERQNLTMRMSIRRFTRLTNGFSKKFENHACAVALHFTHYNFCRIHRTLKTTPAIAAGVADHVWEIGELIDLLDTEPAHWQTTRQSA